LLLQISAKHDPFFCHLSEVEGLLWGAVFWWKTSGGCIYYDAVEDDSMLAGDGRILDNSFSLPRSKVWGTVFMKSRYPTLTSGFDLTNGLEGIKHCMLEKIKKHFLWPLLSLPHKE
jgi:hypothetical protein